MEEIKYGQLWARYSELVQPEAVGNYRITFEGLKRAIEEALRIEQPKTGAVWVKASERLPGWGQFVNWRYNDKIPAGKDTVYGMTNRRPVSLHSLEWLDESGTAAGREEDWVDVNDRLPEEGGRYWCYVEEIKFKQQKEK